MRTLGCLAVVLAVGCAQADADGSGDPVQGAATNTACPAGSEPTLLARDREQPSGIYWLSVDDTHVYWVNQFNAAVRRVPKCGGAVETLARPRLAGFPAQVTLTPDAILWSGEGGVQRLLKEGGSPETISGLAGDGTSLFAIFDESNVYFRQSNFYGGSLVTQSRTGGPITTIAASVVTSQGATALDAERVYFTSNGTYETNRVMSVSKQGGVTTLIASHEGMPVGIAVDETTVYWANQNGTIRAARKAGGLPVTIATSTMPEALAIDGSRVYWVDYRDNAIYSVPKPSTLPGGG